MKISNPQTDIGTYLPKFYPKEKQISSIINPLLKNIRQSKVSSYQQLEGISFIALEHKQNKLGDINVKNIFTENPFQRSSLSPYNSEQKQKNHHQKIPRLSFQQKIFSKCNGVESNQFPFQTLDHAQKSRNYSFNLRSRTSDNRKKQKKQLLAPSTADFSRNNQQNQERKKRFLFNNHRNFSQSFDEQLSNYLQLKMALKGPSFSGGKFSKFKKHLVEEINLQQIQKKFYQNPSTVTNYKNFYEKILNRQKKSQMQNYSFNKKNLKTISQVGKKVSVVTYQQSPLKQRGFSDSIKQSFSQTISIEKPFQIEKNERKRKRSLKAVLFYQKNSNNEQSNQNQFGLQCKSLDTIQVKGKKKNILLPKK